MQRRWTALTFAGVLIACSEHSDHRARDVRLSGSARAVRSAAALLAAGDSTYSRGKYDSARAQFRHAIDRATVTHDTLTLARGLTSSGLAAWHLVDFRAARVDDERAVQVEEQARLSHELPRSYNALGLIAYSEGRFGDAIDAYARAAAGARSDGDSATLAKALGNAGLVYSDIGEFDKARSGFEAQRRFAHDDSLVGLEANALGNLGMVSIRSGDPRSAMPLLSRALRLHRSVGSAIGEENVLGQIGTAYDAMGDPQLALSYLDSALTIAEHEGLKQQESDDLQLIADVYDESGEHAQALAYLARAAALGEAMGERKIQGDIAREQARALFALGNTGDARTRAAAALGFHTEAGATFEQIDDELLLAELEQLAGVPGAANDALRNARLLADTLGTPVARAELAIGEARIAELQRDPERVLRIVHAARSALQASTTGREWEANAFAARAYAALDRLPDAVATGRAAMREVERVRSSFASGALRTSFTDERARVYADLAIALLREGRSDEAFSVADAARGRALIEHIAAAGTPTTKGTGADLASAEQLLRRIDRLLEQLRALDSLPGRRHSPDVSATEHFLSGELADAHQQYEALIGRTNVVDRRSAALAGSALPSVTRVREALHPDEAIIEYFVTDNQLVTFVVSPAGVRSFVTPISDDEVLSRVRLVRSLIADPDVQPEEVAPVLRGLFGLLIEPAQSRSWLEGVRRVFIVPHASLAYLPFAALVDPHSGRYLVQQIELVMLPSAGALPTLRERLVPAIPAARAALPAGRTVPAAPPALLFAPFPTKLPGTQAEIVALQHTIAGAIASTGPRATERSVRAALSTTSIVHVATHATLNTRSPMFSRLELAVPAPDSLAPGDDGRLEVHELLDLPIRSPLVFLSGCETGNGAAWSTSYMRGEDYTTLAAAFLFAGAGNVVSTLWRIEDRGAAVFAAAFYRALASRSPADALAVAQRALIVDPAHRSPFYWAAYMISGDGGATPPQIRWGPSVQ